jgi:pSer/pThr/pTyr-binding forkhead associated (FHA) protein
MDDLSPTREDAASAVPPQFSGSPNFVPLRLFLHPAGAMVEVTRADNLVGRLTDADVRLPLPDVSRRHCRLVWRDGRWQVLDLNSLNGVFVNDRQVQQAVLQNGDLLRIGGFVFRVDLGAAAAPGCTLDSLLKSLPGARPSTPRRRAS